MGRAIKKIYYVNKIKYRTISNKAINIFLVFIPPLAHNAFIYQLENLSTKKLICEIEIGYYDKRGLHHRLIDPGSYTEFFQKYPVTYLDRYGEKKMYSIFI